MRRPHVRHDQTHLYFQIPGSALDLPSAKYLFKGMINVEWNKVYLSLFSTILYPVVIGVVIGAVIHTRSIKIRDPI